MANTYVTEIVSGATFNDGWTGVSTSDGSWSADDDSADILDAACAGASDTVTPTMNGVPDILTGILGSTLIDTPFGASAIETLRPGDLVTVVEGGCRSVRPVRRVAPVRIDPARAADPAAACPVRIRRDAFADNVPSRDLLLAPGHCIHVAGRLIPARMLVNGASIVVDSAIADAAFVQLELDRHAILLVEGLEMESARGQGTPESGALVTVAAAEADRVGAVVTTLCVDRAVVEPIRARLARRGERLGLRARAGLPAVSALHLRIADGATIAPVLRDGTIYAFVVPEGATGLRLVGQGVEPGISVASFPDDRRMLGMDIGALGMADIGGGTTSILHLVDSALPGWHALEQDEADCWTNDDAVLPLGAASGPMVLVVEVPAVGPFHACGNA